MKHPPITFRGALQILGHYERPWLDAANKLAGGVILAAGLAPATAAFSAVWGWIDQKNEGAGLLRSALDSAANRLTDTAGLERHQLVIAAHTALVMSAFFDSLPASPLGALYAEAAVADRYKLQLTGTPEEESDSVVRSLYKSDVPIPNAEIGFRHNLLRVNSWAKDKFHRAFNFLASIVDIDVSIDKIGSMIDHADNFASQVAEKYQSHYLEFSTQVPEFAIWSNSMEHAVTHSTMETLKELLSQVVGSTAPTRDMRVVVHEVNTGVLRDPVLDVHTDGYGFDMPFPSAKALFVKPGCLVTTWRSDSRISSEDWWHRNHSDEDDLCLVLARHFTSAAATTRPLLLLGHPGAGKSMVTKMIAASLPDSQYTVVRVPLRHVDANALLSDQVQQALDQTTHGRVQWAELADQSTDITRVLLLDGLDELLQASTTDRADYLVRIAEFQRREADMRQPLAVVVTSRTLVADRVKVQHDTPVIKLKEFGDDQIREWVRNWNDSNTSNVLPEMSTQWALTHKHLAAQPLLLLMLTLYRANRGADAEDELSPADLYGRLIDDFARREVTKREGRPLQDQEVEEAVRRQLRTLAVAALGMFNRGRQDIAEAELSADLKSLENHAPSGQRLLAEFFFIHSPEVREVPTVRGYEFLHATFAEYLVAERVVDVLRDVAESAFGLRTRRSPEDDLLFALLSHQPLAIQQPVLEFVHEKLAELTPEEIGHIRQTVDILLTGYRSRLPSKLYGDYRPTPLDNLHSLATYSANLVLLRIQYPLSGAGAHLTEILSTPEPLSQWRSTVDLWKSSLEEAAYHAMLGAVDLVDGSIVARVGLTSSVPRLQALHHARLLHDRETLWLLRNGATLARSTSYLVLRGSAESRAQEWYDHVSSWLLAISSSMPGLHPRLAMAEVPPKPTASQIAIIASKILEATTKGFDRSTHADALHWLTNHMGTQLPESVATLLQHRLVRTEPNMEIIKSALGDRSGRVLRSLEAFRDFTLFDADAIEKTGFTYYCVDIDDTEKEVQVSPVDYFGKPPEEIRESGFVYRT